MSNEQYTPHSRWHIASFDTLTMKLTMKVTRRKYAELLSFVNFVNFGGLNPGCMKKTFFESCAVIILFFLLPEENKLTKLTKLTKGNNFNNLKLGTFLSLSKISLKLTKASHFNRLQKSCTYLYFFIDSSAANR